MHAGYIFEEGETRILFDPIFENPFSVNCHSFPAVEFDTPAIRREKFAAVFISHYHDDHCSFASLDLLDRDTPIYMFCLYDEMFALLRELGFRQVHPLTLNRTVTIGDIAITPKRALDADVDSIFVVRAAGLNILNVVDAWLDDEILQELAREEWDLVLWPFQTMREIEVLTPSKMPQAEQLPPPEHLQQLQRLNPRRIITSSCQFRFEEWSWLNAHYFPVSYQTFADEVYRVLPESVVLRLNPGETRVLHKNSFELCGRLNWVVPAGDQNCDYIYEPQSAVPELSHTARHLPDMTSTQKERIADFMSGEALSQWWQRVSDSQDDFFKSGCRWRLSLYDRSGERQDYDFRIQGSELKLISENAVEVLSATAPDWHSEIPAVKLWAALMQGESLSSLYMRINDQALNKETEKRRSEVDILSDPLLSYLYNGKFASYQRAQLCRLRV